MMFSDLLGIPDTSFRGLRTRIARSVLKSTPKLSAVTHQITILEQSARKERKKQLYILHGCYVT